MRTVRLLIAIGFMLSILNVIVAFTAFFVCGAIKRVDLVERYFAPWAFASLGILSIVWITFFAVFDKNAFIEVSTLAGAKSFTRQSNPVKYWFYNSIVIGAGLGFIVFGVFVFLHFRR